MEDKIFSNYLLHIYKCQEKKNNNQLKINDLINKNNNIFLDINNYVNNNSEFKKFISEKLQEAIDKFDLNNGKEEKRTYVNNIAYCLTNGEIGTHVINALNPKGKFDPFIDEWEIVNIKCENNKYKIIVNNKKGIKHLSAFDYILDEYYTDWIKI